MILSRCSCHRSTPITSSWHNARSTCFNSLSSVASRTEEKAPSSTLRRMSNAARRAGDTSLSFTKSIANLQMYSIEKVSRWYSSLRFGLHFNQAQRGLRSALHQQLVTASNDHFSGPVIVFIQSCRLSTPDDQTARFETGMGVWPRLKTSHTAFNCKGAI